MKQELSPRQKQILYYLSLEQIENSEPVGSIQIKEKYDLDFSPATIRHELFELCQMDYLEQPHTSAGRILSDIGWEALITDFLDNVFTDSFFNPPNDLKELAEILSNKTKTLSIVYNWNSDEIYKTGLEYILNEKTIDNLNELSLIAKSIDNIDRKIKLMKDKLYDKQINVFFKKNNSVLETNKLTFIGTKSNKDKLIIGIITPKVTDYEEHFKLFQSLINSLN